MMKFQLRSCILAAMAAAFFALSAQFASAGTILKLSLGDVGPDMEFSGGAFGVFSTADDTNGATTGEQDTAIDFVGDLSSFTDILTPDASYTLSGVTASGLASVVNGQVGQLFTGGEFQLYDASNALLLDVDITSSALAGTVGGTTGAEFSITNGLVAGGSLAPLLVQGTVSFSIALTDINNAGGPGLAITPVGPPVVLPGLVIQAASVNSFTADADKLIAAEVIPEPSTALLLVVGGLAANALIRRRAL
jgi:hypothetical protein